MASYFEEWCSSIEKVYRGYMTIIMKENKVSFQEANQRACIASIRSMQKANGLTSGHRLDILNRIVELYEAIKKEEDKS